MSNFFDETMQGLLEAAEIAKGNITLTEWENMPGPTFCGKHVPCQPSFLCVQQGLSNPVS